MRYSYYKARHFIVLKLMKVWYWIKYHTPQGKALALTAYRDYTETPMYRERLIHFGEEFANTSYLRNDEYRFFMNRISFRRKLSIFFAPYSYLEKE